MKEKKNYEGEKNMKEKKLCRLIGECFGKRLF
jgi:hypothetical protein